MIYHQRNRRKYSGVKIVIGFFIIILILRVFNINFLSKIFDHPINYILESNLTILNPVKNSFSYFKNKKDLEEKNKQLQLENTDLKLKNLLDENISQEFEYFRNQFGTTINLNNIFKVILRPPFTPFDNIKITGDLKNYQNGDFVFYKNILIGKIVDKDDKYATVELFSSPDKITPIILKGSQFEAKGLGGGRFVFDGSKEFDVKVGDPIVYPDQDILILGTVEFIESKEEDLFKKIYFNLPVSLNMISYVSVGKNKQHEEITPIN